MYMCMDPRQLFATSATSEIIEVLAARLFHPPLYPSTLVEYNESIRTLPHFVKREESVAEEQDQDVVLIKSKNKNKINTHQDQTNQKRRTKEKEKDQNMRCCTTTKQHHTHTHTHTHTQSTLKITYRLLNERKT